MGCSFSLDRLPLDDPAPRPAPRPAPPPGAGTAPLTVHMYGATWCGYCKQQLEEFAAHPEVAVTTTWCDTATGACPTFVVAYPTLHLPSTGVTTSGFKSVAQLRRLGGYA